MSTPQRVERVDPRAVPVVPGDVEAPRAVETSVGDPQRGGAPRTRPRVLATISQAPTGRTRTAEAQRRQVEDRDEAVAPGEGHAVVAADVDLRRLVASRHGPRMPSRPLRSSP